jgi:hypothetical protein
MSVAATWCRTCEDLVEALRLDYLRECTRDARVNSMYSFSPTRSAVVWLCLCVSLTRVKQYTETSDRCTERMPYLLRLIQTGLYSNKRHLATHILLVNTLTPKSIFIYYIGETTIQLLRAILMSHFDLNFVFTLITAS